MTHKDGRVVLSAWVEPVLRDYAREAARAAGVQFSLWVEGAVQRAVAEQSAEKALRIYPVHASHLTDVVTLLEDERDKARAEVKQLSEENERLKDRCASYAEDVESLNECMARLEAALYEARDEAAKRRAEVARLRGALSDVAQWRESSYGGVAEIEEFAREALGKKNGDA